jgi:ribonuclease HI
VVSGPQEIADVLATTYSQASSEEEYNLGFRRMKQRHGSLLSLIPEINHPINSPFSLTELNLALKKCKGRSLGPDGLSYAMLNQLHPDAKITMLQLLNHVWHSRVIPDIWRHAHTIPLLKPNKISTDPESYRPISLTSNLCKLLERIVMRRLNFWIETNDKLDNSQNGFRRSRSVTDNVVILHKVTTESLDNQEHSFCIFFDLKKAYDRVWSGLVIKKLVEWGLGGNIVHFLHNFLFDRTMQVRYNGVTSHIVNLENGVPQGSVAAVTCFLIAVCDFEKDVRQAFNRRFSTVKLVTLSYADDKALVITGRKDDPEVRKAVQFVATFTGEWMANHGLELSPTKTQLLHVCKGRRCRNLSIDVMGSTVKCRRFVDFLGHRIDRHFLWRQHILYRRSTCLRALNAIRMLSSPNFGIDQGRLLLIVDSLISSRLLFGSEVYFGTAKSNLNALQSTYMAGIRCAMGAFRTSPIDSLIFQSGRPSLAHMIVRKNINYAFRVLAAGHINHSIVTEGGGDCRIRTLGDFYREHVPNLDTALSQLIESQWGIPPWEFTDFRIDISLADIKKESVSPTILKMMAMSKIQQLDGHDLYYTDGSRYEGHTAYAVIGPNNSTVAKRLQDGVSVYQAELRALLTAASTAAGSSTLATIITDSLSSLLAIQNVLNGDPTVCAIQKICFEHPNIHFMFIHSHTGVSGNELADQKANEATKNQGVEDGAVGVSDLKRITSNYIKRTRRIEWYLLPATNKLKMAVACPTPPSEYLLGVRKADTVLTRIRIGHSR